jgi:hypothetical protein
MSQLQDLYQVQEKMMIDLRIVATAMLFDDLGSY